MEISALFVDHSRYDLKLSSSCILSQVITKQKVDKNEEHHPASQLCQRTRDPGPSFPAEPAELFFIWNYRHSTYQISYQDMTGYQRSQVSCLPSLHRSFRAVGGTKLLRKARPGCNNMGVLAHLFVENMILTRSRQRSTSSVKGDLARIMKRKIIIVASNYVVKSYFIIFKE